MTKQTTSNQIIMLGGQEKNIQQHASHQASKEVIDSKSFLVFTNTSNQVIYKDCFIYKDQTNNKQSMNHGKRTRKEHSSHQASKQVFGGIVVIISVILIKKSL